MTTEITPTTDQVPGPVLELVEADPATLVIGTNVRLDPQADKSFVASIKERGVLEAVTVYRDEDGQLVVVRGQRRTLAAVQVGLARVPVTIRPKPVEADRVIDQVVENKHRAEMRPGELAGAYEQLAGFGLSAAQIAKQTATKRAEVTAGLAVAGSELARKATERWDFLTLDQAAALAEFQDDTEATKALVAGAKEGQFEHVVQRLRDDRDEARALAVVAAELTAAGVTVIERPGYNSPSLRLDRLTHQGVEITEQSHRDCAGHAAFVATEYSWDYTNDDRPVQVEQRGPVWVCTDPAANGHTDRWSQRSTPAGETGDDQEKAAERRRVLAGNRAWRSATTVRREWLQSFAARKTPPEGAERFLIAALLHGDDCLRRAMEAGCNHRRLRVLLGMAEDDEAKTYGAGREHIAQLVEQTTTATPKRAVQLAVALVLAAWEDQTGPHTWRNPDERGRRYLRALAGWGYPLSEIEAPIVATEEAAD